MSTHYVFASDALIRFRNGLIVAHTTSSNAPPFQTDQPALIGWLCLFAKPCDVQTSLQNLPEQQHTLASKAFQYLVQIGVLVEVDTNKPEGPSEQTQQRAREHLKILARSIYDLACDIHAFGPEADKHLQAKTGLGLEQRLLAMLAGADGLRAELSALKRPYLGKQLQALNITADSKELKLHLGAGHSPIDGWINIDIYPAPLAMNAHWGLPFADHSVRTVFVSHMLEHMFYPNDVHAFLKEARRVLAPGGVMRVIVPDIEQCIEAYVKRDASFFSNRRQHWGGDDKSTTRLQDFLAYAGAGPDPIYLFEAHKFGYDFETLAKVLDDCGFTNIQRSSYMTSPHDALRVDDHSEVAGARYGERFYSLFVEAHKP